MRMWMSKKSYDWQWRHKFRVSSLTTVLKLQRYNRESYFVRCPSLVGDDTRQDAH